MRKYEIYETIKISVNTISIFHIPITIRDRFKGYSFLHANVKNWKPRRWDGYSFRINWEELIQSALPFDRYLPFKTKMHFTRLLFIRNYYFDVRCLYVTNVYGAAKRVYTLVLEITKCWESVWAADLNNTFLLVLISKRNKKQKIKNLLKKKKKKIIKLILT